MVGPGKKGAKGYGTSLPGGLRWEMDQVAAAGAQPAAESQARKPQQLSRKDKRAQLAKGNAASNEESQASAPPGNLEGTNNPIGISLRTASAHRQITVIMATIHACESNTCTMHVYVHVLPVTRSPLLTLDLPHLAEPESNSNFGKKAKWRHRSMGDGRHRIAAR